MTSALLGVTLPQFTEDGSRLLDGARRAEAAGLDSVWVFDHLWPLSGERERPIIEAWTAIASVAAATERIRLGTLVTRASLRHPVLLAKMAATVGAIAPGRLIVGIGSGDHLNRAENESFGLPFLERDERVPHLASTVEIVKAFLTTSEVTARGRFATIEGLPASPRPRPRPALWVGGRADEVLAVAARHADGWNAWGSTPAQFARDAGTIAEMSDGRPVELSWAGQVVLAETDGDAHRKLGSRDPADYLVGSPVSVAERLRAYVDAGARHLIVALPNAADPHGYELLATAVRPELG